MKKTAEEYTTDINTKTGTIEENNLSISNLNTEINTLNTAKTEIDRILSELDETYNLQMKRNGGESNISEKNWFGNKRNIFKTDCVDRYNGEYGCYYWGIRDVIDNIIYNLVTNRTNQVEELENSNSKLQAEIDDLNDEKMKL